MRSRDISIGNTVEVNVGDAVVTTKVVNKLSDRAVVLMPVDGARKLYKEVPFSDIERVVTINKETV